MGTTLETTVSIPESLFDQVESVAKQLQLSHSDLFELAIANFLKTYQNPTMPAETNQVDAAQSAPHQQVGSASQDAKIATPLGSSRIAIKQGDIYWLQIDEPSRSEPGYPHPHVVIQDDAINGSRIHTVVVCALTSNLKRATEPGNLLLEVGEANLSKQSVIVVSQVDAVDKAQLGEYIGSLSKQRVDQILAGMRFQQLAFFARYQAR